MLALLNASIENCSPYLVGVCKDSFCWELTKMFDRCQVTALSQLVNIDRNCGIWLIYFCYFISWRRFQVGIYRTLVFLNYCMVFHWRAIFLWMYAKIVYNFSLLHTVLQTMLIWTGMMMIMVLMTTIVTTISRHLDSTYYVPGVVLIFINGVCLYVCFSLHSNHVG